MARFKEVELKRQGCVSLVSRMYSDDTLFDYVVYVNANGKIHSYGFANGLEQQLEQSLIEMNLHPKYELAVVGVPTVVKEWANKKIKVTKSKSRYVTNEEAYKLGNQHGLEYKVKRTDLLES